MARSMGRTDGHVITNGIVIVNIVFRVCIADCRRAIALNDPGSPVRVQKLRSSVSARCRVLKRAWDR